MTFPFEGFTSPPYATLTDNGDLCLDAVEKHVELLLENNIVGVFLSGSTGESVSLTVDERLQLTERWREVTRGTPLKLNVHVGHHCLKDCQILAKHAWDAGVDAISVMGPSFFRPESPAQLLEFCKSVAEFAPELPFYYYDIPVLTNVRLSMLEFLKLSSDNFPQLAGLKYSNPDLEQMQECVQFENSRYEMLFGCDQFVMAGITLGATGAIGTTYNFAPKPYQKMFAAMQAGDFETARQCQFRCQQLIRTLSSFGFLSASKLLMAMIGVPCGALRSPLRNLNQDEKQKLVIALEPFADVLVRPLQTELIGV